jgi:hypothetical protein
MPECKANPYNKKCKSYLSHMKKETETDLHELILLTFLLQEKLRANLLELHTI